MRKAKEAQQAAEPKKRGRPSSNSESKRKRGRPSKRARQGEKATKEEAELPHSFLLNVGNDSGKPKGGAYALIRILRFVTVIGLSHQKAIVPLNNSKLRTRRV